jgi:anti-anti-sigma factor
LVEAGSYRAGRWAIWRLAVTSERRDGVVILVPAGRIGTLSAGEFGRALGETITSGERRVIVDFEGVDYISSPGLRTLEAAAQRVRAAGGEMVLCTLSEPVRAAFGLAGFLPRFAIEPSRDGAIARLS